MTIYYGNEYSENLKKSLEFQDFATAVMLKEYGLAIVGFSTQKYQFAFGENMTGIEIKNDRKFNDTGNLYIEIAEKTKAENPEYYASGIYRNDNSWLYLIGDMTSFWVFGKRFLQKLYEAGLYEFKQTPSSQGYLLPIADAEKYYLLKHVELVQDSEV